MATLSAVIPLRVMKTITRSKMTALDHFGMGPCSDLSNAGNT
jgi:hypothetical protein